LEEQTRGEKSRGASNQNSEELKLTELELRKDGIFDQLMKEKAKPLGERSEEKINELEKLMSVASSDYQNFFWEMVESGAIGNDFSNSVNPEDLDNKRFNLNKDMLVLQYLVTEDKLIIFIAAHDTLGAKIIDIDQVNLEKFINSYYNMLVDKADIELLNNAAEQLYKALILPVEPFMQNRKMVAFVPTGVLMKLPFQSLGNEKDDRFVYLGERFKVFYINDMGQTVVSQSLDMSTANLLAFGNADNSLPFAEQEVRSISKMFVNSSVYLQSQAREDIAKTEMKNFTIVHFATHGNLDPIKFNNSYLTMAPNTAMNEDGMLTISEVNRINLNGIQLIVLSACNTAVNDDKLNGWINNPAKAFIRKGAKSAIASLWAVDDAATGELMNVFYKNLLDGKTKVEAIAAAQLYLLKSEKFSHPYYWAAFELIGQYE
jgi:CHAT domain-containing protein